MKAPVFNQQGERIKETSIPDSIFAVAPNADVLHQVVRILEIRKRKPIADAKDRSDVSGGGKKPWRQKGTGRARHGSIRSPLWKGGGVTHGPMKERNFNLGLNKKMKDKAFRMALSLRAGAGRVAVLDREPSFDGGKTKQAARFLAALQKALGKGKVLFVHTFSEKTEARAFRNLREITWQPAANVTILDVLRHPTVVFTEASLASLKKSFKSEA